MNTTCKNCGHSFAGNYCNHCGQTSHTHKLNFHFVWHDIQHGIFHVDKGILYSIVQLFTRPGHTVREFIEGKRIQHFKPISMVVILATVYGVLNHYFIIDVPVRENFLTRDSTPEQLVFRNDIHNWIDSHFAWTTLISLPFFAFGSFIAFRKQGYNFIEHMVLNAFISAQRLSLHIIVFPLIYALSTTPATGKLKVVLLLVDLILVTWTYIQFFNRISKGKTFLFTLLSYAIFAVSLIIILGTVLGIIGATMYE